MVTYIFYYIRILYILVTLIFQKYKKICRKEKKIYPKACTKPLLQHANYDQENNSTDRRLYVYVVLNGVICPPNFI